jgi:hypothetical protein
MMLKSMAESSETECGLVILTHKVMTRLGGENDAEEIFTEENPRLFRDG